MVLHFFHQCGQCLHAQIGFLKGVESMDCVQCAHCGHAFMPESILLIAGVIQFRICHKSTSRLLRTEYSICHRDQKGESSGSANVAGFR